MLRLRFRVASLLWRHRDSILASGNTTQNCEMAETAATGESVTLAGETATFASLGVCEPLCDACSALGWKAPTAIQREALPYALESKDIIGLAETGSGKTGAFALPILQGLLESRQRLYACILAPTRELAVQIAEQIDALGSGIGVRTAVIVGGVDMMSQSIALARKPHIVIGTPGRLVDHLENTKGFSLRSIKFLVLDEADRMLSMDFEEAINKILQSIPKDRHTYLYSATMTSKVAKLQRASLRSPVKVEVSTKYQTVKSLVQQYLFIPARYKEVYFTYLLSELTGQTVIAFLGTCASVQRLTLMLKNLGFQAVCLHGQMSQAKRLAALNRFKSGGAPILLATDVASRGLDIPSVDVVLNVDVPANGKDYVHRVGRTARAGRSGRAVTFVTQYDIELYQRIEALIGKRLEECKVDEESALVLLDRVSEAQRMAAIEMREMASKAKSHGVRGRKRARAFEDEADADEGSSAAAVIDASEARRKKLAVAFSRNKKSARKTTG